MHKILLIICLLVLGKSNVYSQCEISANSSGANAAYEQVYVLVNSSGYIVDQNTSGTFSNCLPGSYRIHALNYDPLNPPAPLPSDLLGQPLNLVGTTLNGCFNPDFFEDFINKVCATCLRTTTICETDNLLVSTTGENNSYTQLFVLVNAASEIIEAVNSTGDFTGLVSAGNSYQIHALNYDPLNPPSPLPLSGNSFYDIGTMNIGCYNSDYLTDYLCYNVTSCPSGCFYQYSLCLGDDIIATSSGANEFYEQVYVLCDPSQNFIAQNNTGVFSSASLTGGDYEVHALNYSTSDPPSPLPSALNIGDPISNISGGCFNADFLNDYVCFNLGCLLGNNLMDFSGIEGVNTNKLQWTIENPLKIKRFILERSPNGYSAFESIKEIASVQDNNFLYFDKLPLPKSYYRLKILNFDETVEYSNLVYLEQKILTFNTFPNPVNENLNIEFNSPNQTDIEIKIIGVLGSILMERQEKITVGLNKLSISFQNFPSGLYYLQVKSSGQNFETKIIKN